MRRLLVTAALSSSLVACSLPLAGAALASGTTEQSTSTSTWSSSPTTSTRTFGLRTVPRSKKWGPKQVVQPAPSPSPSPTAAPVTEAPVAEAPVADGRAISAPAGVDVTTLGAVGDGVTDDTAALQRAFDAMAPGSTMILPAGKVFAHSDILRIRVAGAVVTGGGTLLATNEGRSSVWLEADDVLLQDVVVRNAATTRRWDAYEQMGLRLAARDGIVVRRVGVYGSAAAGIYVGGATNFVLDDIVVQGTRADGIHMTESSSDGTVRNARVTGVGDDGIAVVTYGLTSRPAARISVTDSVVKGNHWGRGFTVVGGEDISFSRITAEASNAAALYFASEGHPYYTTSVRRITVDGARLLASNTSTTVDHGAVLLWNGHTGAEVTDVALRNVVIQDTRSTANRHVGVLTEGARISGVEMTGFTVNGGPRTAFVSNAPQGSVVRRSWTQDGATLVP
jgi:polygalacturonase